ncbi:MAG: FCD domain-containing protein [Micromonosporaceae bacterium]|nr:FCD domain-containing protein [Micromonosporaceae bacterium]
MVTMATSGSGKGPSAPAVAKDSAYDKLKAAILDGTLAAGAALVESSVAEWCGVSRTPVREALTRLEHDGLITRSDRGLVVRERSPEEILDIYEVRIVLEAAAARLAAERHTKFDLIRLERLIRRGEEIDPDPDAMADYNREFHRAVWQAARNEALLDVLSRLNLHLVRYPVTTLSYPGRWKQALLEHRQLVDAITDRDASKAAEVARVHFTEARDVRLRLWEQDLA